MADLIAVESQGLDGRKGLCSGQLKIADRREHKTAQCTSTVLVHRGERERSQSWTGKEQLLQVEKPDVGSRVNAPAQIDCCT